MKKLLLFLFLAFSTFHVFSQITFEKGYFIDNSDQKVECLIRNLDWNNNPSEFIYKLSETEESLKGTINTVKEFEIYNISKYIRKTVNIDKSSEDLRNLSYSKEPIFKEETLFLNVLIEGQASLFEYTNGDIKRYFYTIGNSDLDQLIFKSYKTSENKIDKNNRFRQQLWNDLKCPDFTIKQIEDLGYNRGDLARFFKEYNECNNHKYISYKNKKRDLFNLNIRPGLNSASLTLKDTESTNGDSDFGNKLGFRFGIEAEFILPFYKNKWAILLEPTYQNYKSGTDVKYGSASVDYKSIELPIGIRHYFFLDENSKIFVNGSYVLDFSFNSNAQYTPNPSVGIKNASNFALGLGYKYDRYSVEMRYQTGRAILGEYIFWKSEYNSFSAILGYSLF